MVDTAVKLELQYRQIASAMKKCNLDGANDLFKDLKELDKTLERDEKGIQKALILAMEEGVDGKKFDDYAKNKHVVAALKVLEGDLVTLDTAIKALQAYSKEAGKIHGELDKLLGQVDKELKSQQQALAKASKSNSAGKNDAKAVEGFEKFRTKLNTDTNEMDKAAHVALLIDKYLLVYPDQKDKVLKGILKKAQEKTQVYKLDDGLTDTALAKLKKKADDLSLRTNKTLKNALLAIEKANEDAARAQAKIAREAVEELKKLAADLREKYEDAKASIKDDELSKAIAKKITAIENLWKFTNKDYLAQKAKLPK